MTVSLCVASRGRPKLLERSLEQTIANISLPDTRVIVALDLDDRESLECAFDFENFDRVIVSVAAREDSLGEKYNRCQKLYKADLYVVGCDDTVIATKGWDEKLSMASTIFGDNIAVVYFGDIPGVFQPGIAITHGLVERMGYFMTPYFPFWWHDTWIDEIGHMINRIVKADVAVESIGQIKETRGARDIPFWARVFDETRPIRRKIADSIIAERIDGLVSAFAKRNSSLRDPDHARQFEGFDAPEDQRYLRLKSSAEQLLGEQNGAS